MCNKNSLLPCKAIMNYDMLWKPSKRSSNKAVITWPSIAWRQTIWFITMCIKSANSCSRYSQMMISHPQVWRLIATWFNINMSSYQNMKSHCGNKTVVRSSYLHNGISYTGTMSSLYWIGSQKCYWYIMLVSATTNCMWPLLLTWFNFNPSMDK